MFIKDLFFFQEKLKLEIETRQSENSMLQSRVSTVEENCSFLEGQVRFLSVSATVGFGIYLFYLY